MPAAESVDSQGNPKVPDTVSVRRRDGLAEKLQAKDPAQWTQQELDEYLGYALWSVFSATEMYKDVMGFVPEDKQFLVDIGYLSTWPLNPFDGWRPVRLLTPANGFSPGDIVWQSDPASAMAYELAIYGSDPAAPIPTRCVLLPGHEAWAQLPAGARYVVGATAETMSQTQQRMIDAGATTRMF